MLNLPNLHDGFLDGVSVSDNRETRLFLRAIEGIRLTVVLQETAAMYLGNMRQGNIIFEVEYIEPEQLTLDCVRDAYHVESRDEVLEKLLIKAKDAKLSAIRVNPSYGAECICLFSRASTLSGHILPAESYVGGNGAE